MENTVEESVETPVEMEAEKTFTQSDVERLIEQRLMRERKKYEKKLEGVDIDEAKRLLEEKQAAEIERQKEKGEFEKVLQQLEVLSRWPPVRWLLAESLEGRADSPPEDERQAHLRV